MTKRLRPVIGLLLLVAFLIAGVLYLVDHPSLLHQLGRTPLRISLSVFGLNILMFGALMLILHASLQLCRKRLNWRENSLLNAHSLFINFFVPGQGGPAYRGVYLNKRKAVRIKDYIIVTLLYYGMYAVISICLLLINNRPWWQTILAIVVVSGISLILIRGYSRRANLAAQALAITPKTMSYLFGAALLQAIIQVVIYSVELHSVNAHIRLSQVITYTGAANLALFVSLTPGAIGIRESFLIFTEHLHHISSANIIVANVIDRSVYLAFLLLLLVATISLHLRGNWQPKNLAAQLRQAFKPAGLPESVDK